MNFLHRIDVKQVNTGIKFVCQNKLLNQYESQHI